MNQAINHPAKQSVNHFRTQAINQSIKHSVTYCVHCLAHAVYKEKVHKETKKKIPVITTADRKYKRHGKPYRKVIGKPSQKKK